jgi:hypothetical protein
MPAIAATAIDSRAFGGIVYSKTEDIRLTQRFARHQSILTTSVYSHPIDEDLIRAVGGMPC